MAWHSHATMFSWSKQSLSFPCLKGGDTDLSSLSHHNDSWWYVIWRDPKKKPYPSPTPMEDVLSFSSFAIGPHGDCNFVSMGLPQWIMGNTNSSILCSKSAIEMVVLLFSLNHSEGILGNIAQPLSPMPRVSGAMSSCPYFSVQCVMGVPASEPSSQEMLAYLLRTTKYSWPLLSGRRHWKVSAWVGELEGCIWIPEIELRVV